MSQKALCSRCETRPSRIPLSGRLIASCILRESAVALPNVEPAAATVSSAKRIQLTNNAVDSLVTDASLAGLAEYFVFENSTERTASFYDTRWGKKDALHCADVIQNFTNPLFHHGNPTSNMWPIFQGRTCMPTNDSLSRACTLGGYPEYAVKVANVAQIQVAINFARAANLRLVIKNTGHCYLGKSTGAGSLSLWMHNMDKIDYISNYKGPGYSGPALKLAAGVTVRQVYEAADKNGKTVLGAVSWSVGYAGGMITGGGQNPLAGIYGMAADHVVAFQFVTADGRSLTISEAEHPNLFWALRGGGGGTFAVVTSVIIRAHPKLNIVTSKSVLDASSNGVEAFWKGTKNSYDVLLDWADAGIYSFFVMGQTPAPFLNMMFLFAPNHTMESPFFEHLDAHNITLTSPHSSLAHTSFYAAYQATWGSNSFLIGLDNSLPANRTVPRVNFQEKYNETFALIKGYVMSGKHLLGYHKAPKKYANVDNAVNPAWRERAMFLVTSSNKVLDHSTPAALAIANKDLQENILQPSRDITPASVMEPDWQDSFYGGYYPRLSGIKKKYDPKDVFYATTAVGSERWRVEDGEQGVEPQNGRLCRV
ncbi:FAD-binding domain-containing protein [Setomelanomma holmii]|uniref:FAD-binding domain-containing protein n=1 Tax=Setomelanomma holmii TaxID=210430 RepID=A0A9P4GWR8_9PLEO|nr:FAD-binding domain-containing protein [Setomelanomma holmii]